MKRTKKKVLTLSKLAAKVKELKRLIEETREDQRMILRQQRYRGEILP